MQNSRTFLDIERSLFFMHYISMLDGSQFKKGSLNTLMISNAHLFAQSDIRSFFQLDQRVCHLLVFVRVHVGQLILEKPLEERFNPLVQMLRGEFTRLKINYYVNAMPINNSD